MREKERETGGEIEEERELQFAPLSEACESLSLSLSLSLARSLALSLSASLSFDLL